MARKTTRRDFGKGLGAAGLAGLVPHPSARACAAQSESSMKPDPSAAALAAFLVARYGAFVAEADRARLEKLVVAALKSAESVRAVPLANADEPDSVFRAVPGAPRGRE